MTEWLNDCMDEWMLAWLNAFCCLLTRHGHWSRMIRYTDLLHMQSGNPLGRGFFYLGVAPRSHHPFCMVSRLVQSFDDDGLIVRAIARSLRPLAYRRWTHDTIDGDVFAHRCNPRASPLQWLCTWPCPLLAHCTHDVVKDRLAAMKCL